MKHIAPAAVLCLALAGCGGGQQPAAPAPTVTVTQPAPAPAVTVTETQQSAPSEAPSAAAPTPTERSVKDEPSGLICRDLNASGYSYKEAVSYWNAHGKPTIMDENGNGVPCEVVYPRSDVVAYYGPNAARAEPTRPTAPRAEPTRTEAASAESTAQANAREKASEYLQLSAFSRKGLIKQLEFEGFSKANATYGVDKQNVNWNKQAEKKAQEYLDFGSFSRSGLIKQLEFEGFTPAQARQGVSAVGL